MCRNPQKALFFEVRRTAHGMCLRLPEWLGGKRLNQQSANAFRLIPVPVEGRLPNVWPGILRTIGAIQNG